MFDFCSSTNLLTFTQKLMSISLSPESAVRWGLSKSLTSSDLSVCSAEGKESCKLEYLVFGGSTVTNINNTQCVILCVVRLHHHDDWLIGSLNAFQAPITLCGGEGR